MVIKLFFATDIHGSEICLRKFLNALRIYKVNIGILLGDLSGKMINPIIKQPNGSYICNFLGQEIIAKTEEELQALQKRIAITGNYYFITTQEEVSELMAEGKTLTGRIDAQIRKIHLGAGKTEELFKRLVIERLKSWDKIIEEKMKNSGIKVFIAPGNDDLLEVNEVLDNFTYAINTDSRKVTVNDHEMITLSWSNPTPWDTPRECSEDELAKKINELASQIEDMEKAIFNFHVPPYGTSLDLTYKLSKDLVPSVNEMINVGSTAVLKAIKEYQPLLGLHGHIHESRASQKIGRTVCVNPGSEYSEGILRGVIITLDETKVKNVQFTSG
jgi:Icc-related predicted phosphoesterase